MRKEPAIDGDEHDWTTKWRKLLKYCERPGVGKRVKRKMNRRARRKARAEIQKHLDEESHETT